MTPILLLEASTMVIDVVQYIEGLKEKLGEGSKTYQNAVRVMCDHPHLRAFREEGNVLLSSTDINPFTDSVEFLLENERYWAKPYTLDKGVRLHSNPHMYLVGWTNPDGFGIIENEIWTEAMVADKIGSDVQKKVKAYLGAHAVANYDELEILDASNEDQEAT